MYKIKGFFIIFLFSNLIYFPILNPAMAQDDQFKIFLKARQFVPEADISTSDAAALSQQFETTVQEYGVNKVHAIVQLTHTPSDAEKMQLKSQGVELISYIPNKAWYAAISIDGETASSKSEIIAVVALQVTDKIEPKILVEGIGDWAVNPDGTVSLQVIFFEDVSQTLAQTVLNKYSTDIQGPGMLNDWVVKMPEALIQGLAAEDFVKWVNEIPPPLELHNDGSRAVVRVNSVQTIGLSGNGVNVGIWDGGEIGDHSDLNARVTIIDNVGANDHATHVAGTLGGDGIRSEGSTSIRWRGMAPDVSFFSYKFDGDVPEELEGGILTYDIDLSQNSWGYKKLLTSYYGNYVEWSEEFDDIVRGRHIPIVFSAGNNQGYSGFYYGSISGPGGTAKNVISVGATNSNDDTVTDFSSWGPTDDGRIKPDVSAPGCERGGEGFIKSTLPGNIYGDSRFCGTSMAAPVVSGTVALMLERYRELFGPATAPLPATYRSLLIQAAKDLGNPGPDYQFGYGRINARKTIHLLDDGKFLEDEIQSHGEVDVHTAIIESNAVEFKVTLVWDDFKGDAAVIPQLVNDLDLVIVDPNGTEYFPWILDHQNPANPATKGEDHINNVEQVIVPDPMPGVWTIKVKGTIIPQAPQNYSLVKGAETPEFLLTANVQDTIDIRLSNGDGTFVAHPISVGNDLGVDYSEFAIADFNGDGLLDFIASINEDPCPLFLFTRTATGTFEQTFLFYLDSDPKAAYYLNPFGGNNPLLAPDYGLGLIAADLDNDGDMDFLENINHDFGGNKYWIAKGNAYLNDGSGIFTKESNAFDFHDVSTGWALGMSSTLMDVDGDNIPDMLASEQSSGSAVSSMVFLLKGSGDGTFIKNSDGTFQAPNHVFTTSKPATFITLGDFNNDGKADALVGQDDDGDPGAAFLFKGHGDGTFSQNGIEAFDTRDDIESGHDQPGHGKFRAYDADHDGILDIISAAGTSGPVIDHIPAADLLFFRGHGDGSFDTPQTIDTNILLTTAFTAPPTPVLNVKVIGDLDGNRCVDRTDFDIILADIRGPEPHAPSYDLNGDGEVNIADARKLVTQFWNPRGAACP